MIDLLRFLLLLLILLPLKPALANIGVQPMRLHVEAGKGSVVRVHSESPQPQYIQATLKRIVDPATEQEQEVDAREGSEAVVALTPSRFVLAAGSSRLVRVIALQPVQQETAYRVYFEGVRGPSEDDAEPISDGARAQVGVSLVWGALLHVLPADGRVSLRHDGDRLHNDGTLRLGITQLHACTASGSCSAHTIERSVYPGASLPLPAEVASAARLDIEYRLSRDGYRQHRMQLHP